MFNLLDFAKCPITATAFRVLAVLATRLDGQSGLARYPLDDLAEDCRLARRTTTKALAELEEMAILERIGSTSSLAFKLGSPPARSTELVNLQLAEPVDEQKPQLAHPGALVGARVDATDKALAHELAHPDALADARANPRPLSSPPTPPSSYPHPCPRSSHAREGTGPDRPEPAAPAPDRPEPAAPAPEPKPADPAAEQRIRDHARNLFGQSVDELGCLGYHAARSLAQYPEGWISEALTSARAKNASPPWSYIRAILIRYHGQGGPDQPPGASGSRSQGGRPYGNGPSHGGHTAATRPRPERDHYQSPEHARAAQRRLIESLGFGWACK
jgi:hypothetical protein